MKLYMNGKAVEVEALSSLNNVVENNSVLVWSSGGMQTTMLPEACEAEILDFNADGKVPEVSSNGTVDFYDAITE